MLARLLSAVKSMFGAGQEPAAADTRTYECAVCGTRVSAPDGSCSLCRSTEVVPAGEGVETPTAGGLSGSAKTARSQESADDAAERLRALREERARDREH